MDSTSLQQQQQQQQQQEAFSEFRAGVTAALRSWSALRAAVESSWGGNDSHAKADDLRSNILEAFDGVSSPKISLDELEDNLALYMEEEFSVILEDGSARQVADVIWQMYDLCGRGDISLARQVVAAADSASVTIPAGKVAVQAESEMDDDDDDIVMGKGSAKVGRIEDGTSAAAQEYASASLFDGGKPKKPVTNQLPPRQLGEAAPEKPEEDVDADGFALIAPRKGRRSKQTM